MSDKKNVDPKSGLTDEQVQRAYDLLNPATSAPKSQFGGLSDISTFEGTDDFSTYERYGIPLVPFIDLNEERAQRQPFREKVGRGIAKFAGKTGTAVAGATLGTIYGFGSAVANGELNKFYDNDFQHTMDDWNERMDENMAHYYTRAEQEAGFFKSLGSANFWWNDVAGGLSFTTGAILSELMLSAVTAGSFGTGAAMQAAATAKLLSKGKTLLKGVTKAKRSVQQWNAATVGRQLLTGAGYESGVEARHYKDQAMQQYQESHPNATAKELAKVADFINMQSNMVFAANLALVGHSNAVQFKQIFGKGLKTQAKAGFTEGVKKESGDFLTGKFKESVADATKRDIILDKALRVIKNPIYEGVIEEGGQSVFTNTALNYLDKAYDMEATKASYDLTSAFHDALGETYGTKEGWKEIGIGMIIGAMGSPTFRKMPWQEGGWSGGISDSLKEFKGAVAEQKDLAERNNEWTFDNIRENIKSHNQTLKSNEAIGESLDNGDLFGAKDNEADSTFGYLSARNEAGMMGDTVDEFVDMVQKMNQVDFKNEFGYDAETEAELTRRKGQVIESFKQKAADVRTSMEDASTFEPSQDYEEEDKQNWKTGLGHLIYRMKDLDRRETSVIGELQEEVPGINPQHLKLWMQFKGKIAQQKGKTKDAQSRTKVLQHQLDRWTDIAAKAGMPDSEIAQLNKELKELKDRRDYGNPDQSKKFDRRIEQLEKRTVKATTNYLNELKNNTEISAAKFREAQDALEKLQKDQVTESQQQAQKLIDQAKSFDYDTEQFDSFEEAMKDYGKNADMIKGATTPTNRAKLQKLTGDLNKMQHQRQALTGTFNWLFTPQGQEEFMASSKSNRTKYDFAKMAITNVGAGFRGKTQTAEEAQEELEEQAKQQTEELNKVKDKEFAKDWAEYQKDIKNNLDLEDHLDVLEEWLTFFEAKANKYQGEKHDNYAKAAAIVEVEISKAEQNKKKATKKKNELSSKPLKKVVAKSNYLNRIQKSNTPAPIVGMLNSMSGKEIVENSELSVDDYEGKNKWGDTQNHNKTVNTTNGHTKLKGKAVHMWVKSERKLDVPGEYVRTDADGNTWYKVGYLPDPRRFVDDKGQPLEISNTPEGLINLAAINYEFVNKGVISTAGADFLARYDAMVDIFENELNEENSSHPAIKLGYVNSEHSTKILWTDDRPSISDYFEGNDYDVTIKGVGTGLFLVDRNDEDPENHQVGNNIWFREEGVWRQLQDDEYIAAEKFINNAKDPNDRGVITIPQGGQYALIASNEWKGKRQPVAFDIGKPAIKEVKDKKATWESIQEQFDAVKNEVGLTEKGVKITDSEGRPLFVAVTSDAFKDGSGKTVRTQLRVFKFEKGKPIIKILFTHDGEHYSFTVAGDKLMEKMTSFDDFTQRIAKTIEGSEARTAALEKKGYNDRLEELKLIFPNLEFSSLQAQYDQEPGDLGNLMMNAVPHQEIDINGKKYKEYKSKIKNPAETPKAGQSEKKQRPSSKRRFEKGKGGTTKKGGKKPLGGLSKEIPVAKVRNASVNAGTMLAAIVPNPEQGTPGMTNAEEIAEYIELNESAWDEINLVAESSDEDFRSNIVRLRRKKILDYMSSLGLEDTSEKEEKKSKKKPKKSKKKENEQIGFVPVRIQQKFDKLSKAKKKAADFAINDALLEEFGEDKFVANVELTDKEDKKWRKMVIDMTTKFANDPDSIPPIKTVREQLDESSMPTREPALSDKYGDGSGTLPGFYQWLNNTLDSAGNVGAGAYMSINLGKNGIMKVVSVGSPGVLNGKYKTIENGKFKIDGTLEDGSNISLTLENIRDMAQSISITTDKGKTIEKWKKPGVTSGETIVDDTINLGRGKKKPNNDIESKEQKDDLDFIFGKEDEDDGIPFKMKRAGEKFEDTPTSYAEKKSILRRILPDWISDAELDTLVGTLNLNGVPFGAYFREVVYLSNDSGNKTAYHEAFHAVFRSIFSPAKAQALIEKAKSKYPAPTKANLKALAENAQASGYVLTPSQLTDLYYEEKMADDFMEYAYDKDKKVTGWLSELINKIKRWIKAILGNKSELETVFNDIYNGKFKNSERNANELYKDYAPAYLTIETVDVNGEKIVGGAFGILNKESTNNIKYTLLNTLISKAAEDPTFNPTNPDTIREELEERRQDYYDPKKWAKEIRKVAATKDRSAAEDKYNRIRTIYNALGNPDNINRIVKDMQTHLRNIDLVDPGVDEQHQNDLDEQEATYEGENDFGRFDRAIYELGGISSMSKFMREYIFMTTDILDEFGFGTSEADMAANPDKYERIVNGNMIYAGIQRSLVNTDAEEIFSKFKLYAKANRNAAAFYDKVIRDIAIQVDMTEVEVEALFDQPMLNPAQMRVLGESYIFNSFLTTFIKDQVDFYTILFDKGKGTKQGDLKVFSSNRVGTDTIQLEAWRGDFEARKVNNKTIKDLSKALRNAYTTAATVNEKQDLAENADVYKSIDEHAEEIAEMFNQLGISFSPAYVKWSLLDYHKDKWQKMANFPEFEDKYNEWNRFYTAFKGAEPIHNAKRKNNVIQNKNLIFNLLPKWAREYPVTKENPAGFFVMLNPRLATKSTGLGTLKKLAKSNSMFDETVGDSTFRNAEGKQVFDKLPPTYITTLFRRIRKSGLSATNLEPLFKALKIKDDYRKDMLRQVLANNNLLKGTLITKTGKFESAVTDEEYAQFIIDQLQLVIADGIREESFNEAGKLQAWKKSDGARTMKHLSAEGQELFKLAMYANSGRQNDEIAFGDNREVDFRFFLIGNSEKSTQNFVKMPISKNVITDISINEETGEIEGNLSDYSKEAFYNLMGQEYERIQKIVKEIAEIKAGTKTDFISKAYHGSEALWEAMDIDVTTDDDGNITSATLLNPEDIYELMVGKEARKYGARGLQFFKYLSHPEVKRLTLDALSGHSLEDNKELIMDSMNDFYLPQIKQYLDEVLVIAGAVEYEVDKEGNGKYVNKILPQAFGRKEKDFSLEELANFFINHTINTASLNQLLHGDLALNYKDLTFVTKRNGGMIAAGNGSRGDVRFKIASSVEKDIEPGELARHGMTSEGRIDTTDGQNFGNMKFYIDHYLKPSGRTPEAVKPILKKIERGLELVVPLTEQELQVLDKYFANLHDRKIVGRDMTLYDKTSLHTLTRGQTSVISDQFRADWQGDIDGQLAEMNKRYDALDAAREQLALNENEDTKQLVKNAAINVQKMFKAQMGRLDRHKRLDDMDYNAYDLLMYDSALKMAAFDVDTDKVHTVDGEWIKDQVNTDAFKDKVIHSTQMMQLIWSEQDPEAEVEYGGKTVKMKTLVSRYNNLLAQRVKEKAIDFSDTIFQFGKDGMISPAAVRKLYAAIKSGLITDDLWVTELFSTDANGEPIYDGNYPAIRYKFEALYLAFVSNRVFKAKTPGRKYTLVSDEGIEVARERGAKLNKAEYDKRIAAGDQNVMQVNNRKTGLPEYWEVGEVLRDVTGKNAIATRLRHRLKDTDRYGNEILVTECIVSEKAARTYGLKRGDSIPKELAIQMGVRIPTQDKHSMVNLKIVDTIPYYYGNSIILPYEVIELSGADFDIDSLYARMYSVFATDDGVKAYGDYLTSSDPLEDAYLEYRREILSDKKEPMTKDQFLASRRNGKLVKSMILNNVAAFKKGNIDQVEPITDNEMNNMLLDMEIKLAANTSELNAKNAGSPATMKYLKNMREVFASLGIKNKNVVTGVDTPYHQFKAAKSLEIGDKGIGVSAVFNTLFQRLEKLQGAVGIPLFKDYADLSGFDTTLNGKPIRKNDIFSAIVSAMTDNAKELLATEFNLTLDTLGAAMYMMSVGVPLESVLFMMRQPVITEYVNEITAENSPIQLGDRKGIEPPSIDGLKIADERSFFFVKKKLKLKTPKGFRTRKQVEEFLNDQDLMAQMIVSYENEGGLQPEHIPYQSYILNEFIKAKQVSEELRKFRSVTALMKGMETSWYKAERLIEQTKSLGLRWVQQPGSTGLEPDHWSLEQQKTDKGVPKNLTHIDFEELLSVYPLDLENAKAARAQLEGSKFYFILQSTAAKELKTLASYNMNDKFWTYTDSTKGMEDSLLAFLISKAFKRKFPTSFTAASLFKEVEDKKTGETYNPFHRNIQTLKEMYPNNSFLNKIRLEPYTYGSKSPMKGKTIYKVAIETNYGNDVVKQENLIRGFFELHSAVLRRQNENPEVTSIEETTYKQLIGYLVAKDAMMFKNGSFIRAISPALLDEAFISLNDIKALFASESEEWVKVLGTSKHATIKEFNEVFGRWSANTTNLKLVDDLNTKKDGSGAAIISQSGKTVAINVYAGTDATKEGIALLRRNSKKLKERGIESFNIDSGVQQRFPLMIKKGKKPYKLSDVSVKLKKSGITIHYSPDGRVFGLTRKGKTMRKHLDKFGKTTILDLVDKGVLTRQQGMDIQMLNIGYRANYTETRFLGNRDVSPFGNTIPIMEKILPPVEEKKTTKSVGKLPTVSAPGARKTTGIQASDIKKAKAKKKESTGKKTAKKALKKPAGTWGLLMDQLLNMKKGDTFVFADAEGEMVNMDINIDVQKAGGLIPTSQVWKLAEFYNDDGEALHRGKAIDHALTLLTAINKPDNIQIDFDTFMEMFGIEVLSTGNINKLDFKNGTC